MPEAQVVIGEKEFIRSPIAKIPPGGYKIDQYSKSSIQYLEWVSRREGVKIQHTLNGGEVSLIIHLLINCDSTVLFELEHSTVYGIAIIRNICLIICN